MALKKVIGDWLQTIWDRIGGPAGASIAADVAAVKTDTGNLVTRVGTPAAGTVAGDVESVETKVGTNVDAAGTTTLFARLRQIVDTYLADGTHGLAALQALIGAINAATTDSLHGKLGTDTELADYSFYDLLGGNAFKTNALSAMLGAFTSAQNLKAILGDLSSTKRLGQILGLDETDTLKAILGAFTAAQNLKAILGDLSSTKNLGGILGAFTSAQNLKAILGDLSTTKNLGGVLGALTTTDNLKGILGAYTTAANLKAAIDALALEATLGTHDTDIKALLGAIDAVTTDSLHGKLGTDTELADYSFYDLLGGNAFKANALSAMLGAFTSAQNLKAILGDLTTTKNLGGILGNLSTTKNLGGILGALTTTDNLKGILGAYTTAANLKAAIDAIQTIVGALPDSGALTALLADIDPKVMGRSQIFEKSITSAANVGDVTVATITTQPCLIESIVIHADTVQTGDMTSCGIFGGAAKVITFIAAADALQADLDAIDKQVYWEGSVRLAATKTIVISLVGTGATAVDLTIIIKYRACASGGYLA